MPSACCYISVKHFPMPPRIQNEIIDIPLNGGMVKGILSGDETNWSFQSLSRSFLALFADGVVHSYTYLGADSRNYEHHKFQLTVAARVKELLEERKGQRSRPSATEKPTTPVRRYVIP